MRRLERPFFSCNHEDSSLWREIVCHIPYAGFSLACGFVFLSMVKFIGLSSIKTTDLRAGYLNLFHAFHYLHIILAVTGAIITFFRFSKNVLLGIIVSTTVPVFFCISSDILLPVLSARILGLPVHLHICFCNPYDAANLIAFMIVGSICGIALLRRCDTLKKFSIGSHFFHILASSLASIFYLVAHGFDSWQDVMGILFLFLFVAVVVPCTLSDIVVPFFFARIGRRRRDIC